MNSKTAIVAALVVVIVVVAAAAAVLTTGGGDDDSGDDGGSSQSATANINALTSRLDTMRENTDDYPARLMILGNADMDDDLDYDDVKYINNLIANGYDYAQDFMADANYDGLIDEDDVAYVELLMADDYDGIAYYLNSDYKIRSYNMGNPLRLANILTQTLEMECILAPEAIVATDYRAGNPNSAQGNGQDYFWREFASVIDYDNVGYIGNHKTLNAELIVEAARAYGDGYLTVWFNSEYANSTGELETQLASYDNIQILRLPSWENGATANGMLTAGFLFHKTETAEAWVEWYDGYYNEIMDMVADLDDSQRLKVMGAYLYTSEESPDGEYYVFTGDSGEYQNMLRMGIIDVVSQAEVSSGSGWKVTLSDEGFAAVCQSFGCDLLIGTVPGPFGNVTTESIKNVYTERYAALNEYVDEEVDLVMFGWIWASGPMELTFMAFLGNYMYGWDLDIETITNEGLQWLGIYGDGEYQYTYDTVKDLLFYTA